MSCLARTIKKTSNANLHHLKKVKSSDDLNRTPELSISDVRVLLSCNHGSSFYEEYTHQIRKQQILSKNKLFDAHRHFGFSPAHSVQHSARIHSARLDSMFESGTGWKNQSLGKKSARKETLIMGKSPKGYVRENKENYQRNGSSNIQKLRIKLKINKK